MVGPAGTAYLLHLRVELASKVCEVDAELNENINGLLLRN